MPYPAKKEFELKIRVSREMKDRVMELAAERDESEAVIVREALKEYFQRKPSDGKKKGD